MRPSSGLGCANNRRIIERTVGTFSDGTHDPLGGIFSVSRQMRPPVSMFGWYNGVRNRTEGGSHGYLRQYEEEQSEHLELGSSQRLRDHTHRVGSTTSSLKTPPSYGVSSGPVSSAATKSYTIRGALHQHQQPGMRNTAVYLSIYCSLSALTRLQSRHVIPCRPCAHPWRRVPRQDCQLPLQPT